MCTVTRAKFVLEKWQFVTATNITTLEMKNGGAERTTG